MGEVRFVAEHDECRGVGRDLGDVIDLQTAMVEFRGRVHVLGIEDNRIKNRGGYPS